MHIDKLAESLGLEPEDVRRIAAACAESRDVYQALKHRVHIRHASGRDCDDAGVHAMDPDPIRVKLRTAFGGQPAGAVVERPYREAVDLVNNKLAELVG